jgi:tetratricopeptide (TPR) repeat protein
MRVVWARCLAVVLLLSGCAVPGVTQGVGQGRIEGSVRAADGKAEANALVRLEADETHAVVDAHASADGGFVFAALSAGTYALSAEKDGRHTSSATVVRLKDGETSRVVLVISGASAAGKMEFADKPDFTVAGVTDFTAVGGHGSDATLRTSEELTRATVQLKSADHDEPAATMTKETAEKALAAVRAQMASGESAGLHRRAADLEERLGNSLEAVADYAKAARLEPTEENTYAWGSELLLHRAVWEAQKVFQAGVDAYPNSARLHTALGTAMFGGARYGDAAEQFCVAADLNPSEQEPYLFMGKIQLAAPDPLQCIEPHLRSFVRASPANAQANYLYAMVLLKGHELAPDAAVTEQARGLLTKAVALDGRCAEGYLELGILAQGRRDVAGAIDFFRKAIAANPELGDAHYRLGVMLDRSGEHARAKEEFDLHEAIKRKQAEEIEQQRRDVKQFLISAAPVSVGPAAH